MCPIGQKNYGNVVVGVDNHGSACVAGVSVGVCAQKVSAVGGIRRKNVPSGFSFDALGMASSLAWVLFVLVMLLTALQFVGQKRWVNYDS